MGRAGKGRSGIAPDHAAFGQAVAGAVSVQLRRTRSFALRRVRHGGQHIPYHRKSGQIMLAAIILVMVFVQRRFISSEAV